MRAITPPTNATAGLFPAAAPVNWAGAVAVAVPVGAEDTRVIRADDTGGATGA